MDFLTTLKKELQKEAPITRQFLSIIPEDKFAWKPHPKSMDIMTLANHIAELPSWFAYTIDHEELDFATNPYQPQKNASTSTLLEFFEKTLEKGLKDLERAKPSDLEKLWTLREGEIIYSQEPKWEVLRMAVSQIIHHRAQLGVYLRLLDVPIPGSYGPSADEV
ncbi:DinB family protein [Pleomorphovibrio marinus]|uniref:DinB family protein n=1 Tax=Pleomorphovibrio marinus TaxID=2164132 RepID=UPI000E0BE6DE|nr:DinB family protein [Pleomorphovibrio marinus]